MDGIGTIAAQQLQRSGETAPLQVVRPGLGISSPDIGEISGVGNAHGGSFADALGQAVRAVDAQQLEADAQSSQLALGGGNLHETAIALEKADVSMRVAMTVRNKIVDAYQEVMRMGI